jgi:hypothetical protein
MQKNVVVNYWSFSWAFGIVLYEIYTLGQIPFVLIDAKDMIQHLQDGNRPEKPDMATDEM